MNSRFLFLMRLIKRQVSKVLIVIHLLNFGFYTLCVEAKENNIINDKYEFNIPIQPLSQSLNDLSDVAKISFLFPYDLVKNKTGSLVQGQYSVQEALSVLLQNSDLEGELSDKKAFLIKPLSPNINYNKSFGNEQMNTQKTMLATIFTMLFSATSTAEEAENKAIDNNIKEVTKAADIERIEIKGVRGSLNRSLGDKRLNTGIVDTISAEDLGKFPDNNISESLQRIPGVTIEREFGVGSTINLRGLGPEFTMVQINGVSSTSSGFSGQLDAEGGREFDFSLLASELFNQVTIHKTASAKQTEGGLAGVVNLETPKPFTYDANDPKFSTSVQGSYGSLSEETTPRASMFFSNNFDDVFGIAASVAYSEVDTVVNESGTWKYATLDPNITYRATGGDVHEAPNYGHAFIPDDPRYLRNDINRESLGTTLTLQYNASENLQFTFDNIYVSSDTLREYNRIDVTLEWDIGGEPETAELQNIAGNDYIINAAFPRARNRVGTQNIDREETFASHVLSADWNVSDSLTIKPLIGYTKRTGDEETYLYSFYNRIATQIQRAGAGYEFYPVGSSAEYYADQNNAENFLFNVAFSKDRKNEDEELVAKVDFEQLLDLDNLVSIDYGFSASDREKTRDYDFWQMGESAVQHMNPEHYANNQSAWNDFWGDGPAQGQDDLLSGAGMTLASVLGSNRDYSVDSINGPSSLLYVDHDLMQATYMQGKHGDDVENNSYQAEASATGTYGITEQTLAAYIQANFVTDNAHFNIGLRYISTEIESNGSLFQNGIIEPVTYKSDYTEFLPSFNLSYELGEDVLLRTAYSRTMTRPPLASLSPSTTIDASRLEGNKGNVNLLPYTSNNIDFGAEWYFAPESLLAAAFFYKKIDSLVENSVSTEVTTYRHQISNELITGPIDFTQPQNGTDASVQGIEVSFQSPFTFISESLSNFGTIVNFTYTDSAASFADETDIRSTTLPGLSKNSYNAIVYYDNSTFDARLSYAWRSEYVDYFPEAKYQDAYGQLDLSANYNLSENFSIQFDVLNITEETVTKMQSNNLLLPISLEQLERRVMFGIRYSM
ncbi:TonB-dependent receptor [Colwellia sp. 6_MG-2023]|uniref:TonB-dependent receptor n=1 Tax=Colwellia sp. 6_MG-2023 TaxID=3062676 RepID=UPI0026E222DF|nr:TonB-dependent receptor [Colwellia sp. 6_MG-2023]MDO6489375.1 TonB-dependent receptor [Colwellia sp. 6_MG-2023]